ncbi:transglycosylase SLT domain-containing protein [Azospirillum sp. TSO22-1]|uniref:lytic transglycosylase domain-containing protein n=1 Tax=Azospirillum sp. TSO22-1 TaxID=716789 RepID=UPI000D6112BD|nr:transglycosylase SLT domain-containing protein [Azospirillum sp. TSO22-1]PWC53947.1 lytic transglycosylase [Azospirillum sp. TSO22-1]
MKSTLAGLLLAGVAVAVSAPAQAAMIDRTIRALEALAAKGSARAQFELAEHFEDAKGVARDGRRALYLYCKAARQGHADAARRAGRLILKGGAGFRDEELGNAWIHKASTGGAKAPDRCEPPQIRYYAVPTPPPAHIKALVQKMAPTYGLDPELVLAVISAESAFRNDVVSNKNAMGLMQLIPETAERFGVRNVFQPEENIRGGMKYLRWLLAFFQGDVTLALAGYNAGEGAVVQYKGVPPYRETQDYVAKIRTVYAIRRHPYDKGVVDPSGVPGSRELVAELSYSAPKTAVQAVGKRKERAPVTVAEKAEQTVAE